MAKARNGGTVAQHTTHNSVIEGLNPATGPGERCEDIEEPKLLKVCSG